MSASTDRTLAKSVTLDNKIYQLDDINDTTKSLIKECIAAENNAKNKQLEVYFANIAHQTLINKVKTSLQDVKFTDASDQNS
jgi:hypothetical protein